MLSKQKKYEPVLDTVERVSEMCFGLFMALTFVGAVSVATGGKDQGQAIMDAALGCNLAWGLADSVIYLIHQITGRAKRLTLALKVQTASDKSVAIKALRNALPSHMESIVTDKELEAIRARIAVTSLPAAPELSRDDFLGALGVFLIVVLSTFPVALPFVLINDISTALLVSRVLSLVMLFGGGFALGRYAGYSGWKSGFGMVGLGTALTAAIIALGG